MASSFVSSLSISVCHCFIPYCYGEEDLSLRSRNSLKNLAIYLRVEFIIFVPRVVSVPLRRQLTLESNANLWKSIKHNIESFKLFIVRDDRLGEKNRDVKKLKCDEQRTMKRR